jgi:hypothetical protein
MLRRQSHRRGHRRAAPLMTLFSAFLKVILPMILIAVGAYVFLQFAHTSTGMLRITSNIPGADIYLGGIQVSAHTDTTVLAPLGRNIVTIRRAGYISDPEFAVADVSKSRVAVVQFILKLARESVIRDTVANPKPISNKYSSSNDIRSIPPAVMHFDRKLVDYSPRERINPVQTSTGNPDPILAPNAIIGPDTSRTTLSGTQITVTSSGGDKAEIFINGVNTGKVTPSSFHELSHGQYTIQILRPGFRVKPDSVSFALLRDYQSELASFEMTPDLTLPKPTLAITTSPLAAAIRIDGQVAGIGNVKLEKEFGTYRVDFAETPGFAAPAATTVSLTPANPNVEINGEYQRVVGDSYVALIPSEDLGKFDGKRMRVYVDNELIIDGPTQPFDAALIGKVLAGKRLVRVQYGELTNDVYVNTLSGSVSQIVFRVESFFSKRSLRLREKSFGSVEEWRQKYDGRRIWTSS